ncbi:recombinase family protein [Glutamicibacter sp. TV12E]|uniref:recombinase family protein n=1 Tax=Glutamicibacter sp. TV12E TaxID=3446362 RepID=UPI004033CC96
MTTTKAHIYARISRDRTDGLNVAEQIVACENFIKNRGWELGETYSDNSISAMSGAVRPGFEKMLKDAEDSSDTVTFVVYWKQSRLERDPDDLDRFLLAGCEGYATDGTQANVKTASSELMTKMMSLYGRFEQRNKADFQKQANLRIAKAGTYRGSIRPFGQRKDGSWVEEEAEAVIEAAEKIIAGEWSFFRTSEVWNLRGLKTPQTGKQGGKQWTSGTVRNYFTRPRLYGYQDYKGTLYELKDWKPILTKEQFDAIQVKIDSKRTGFRTSNVTRHDVRLLTALIQCADCGRGMNAAQRGGPGSTRSYRCPSTKHVTIIAEPLEEAISEFSLHLLAQHAEVRNQQESTTRRLATVQGEKLSLTKEHEEWLDEAIEAGLKPSIIANKESKFEEEISKLDEEILTLQQDKTVSIFEGFKLEGWNASPIELRRDLLQTLYSGITISRVGQGKRFSPDVIDYKFTPLGERLRDEYLKHEMDALHPWENSDAI